MEFLVDINKIVLSSKSTVYMTQHFFEQSKNLLEIDSFITKIAETVLNHKNKLEKITFNEINCYKVTSPKLNLYSL